MLDINVITDLIRNPQAGRRSEWHGQARTTSAPASFVAAEQRQGCITSGSQRILKAIEDLLDEFTVLPFDVPADAEYSASAWRHQAHRSEALTC